MHRHRAFEEHLHLPAPEPVEKDVTALKCDGDGTAMNATEFNIYDVEGTKLSLGNLDDTYVGTSAATRAVALSTQDFVYAKVP